MQIVKLTGICKDYQPGGAPVRVLKDIDLTVTQGEYIAIEFSPEAGEEQQDSRPGLPAPAGLA